VYDAAVSAKDAPAANAAAAAFNTYNDKLAKDLPGLEKTYNDYVKQYETWNPQIEDLQGDYEERAQYLMSDIEDLDKKLVPVLSGAERVAALAIRPQIDEDKYRELTGIGEDESVWGHYLANQKEINTVFAQEAVDDFNRSKNDITADTAPTLSGNITRPNTYGPPVMPGASGADSLPDVDLTTPQLGRGSAGDPRDFGLTKAEVDAYAEASVGKDTWYNFVSGAYEAAAYTTGGFGTFADEIAENIVNSFAVDTSEADDIAYSNFAIYYDPTLTDKQKADKIAENAIAYAAAREKAFAEDGVNIDTFSGYTDPLKNYIMDASEREAAKISPAMQVRQYNALPAEDTTWEQILTGNAKDRLGRPYGLGDPLATVMSGVQELPDLLVDVALLALTRNPAVLGGTVAVTSMAEAGEAAADEIESNLRSAYDSGALQAIPEFADLVRLYKGDEDAALERLIDQGMGYAAVSGVVGGFADMVLAKVAGASGASQLLNNVPTGLKTFVKIGTGGLSEGITESGEQIPVNMASINAGLDTSVSAGTGVAFLQGTTSGATAMTGAAAMEAAASSYQAVANTVRLAREGKLTYTMPDGSTVTPKAPSGAAAAALDSTAKSLADYGIRVNLLNDLASWDAIPSQPSALTAQELTDTLNNLGIGDTAEITNIVNTAYDQSVITRDEARLAFEQSPITDIPSDAALDKYTGIRAAADFAADVAAYVDPRFLDADEVKAAALAEGITLTDEQAEAYVGEKNESSAVKEIKKEYDPKATTRAEAEKFFTDLGFTPTDAEIAKFVGAKPENTQKTAIGKYVDPRFLDADEVKAAALAEGITLTDKQAEAYVGQKNEAPAVASIRKEYDPKATTYEEAEKFFTDLGFTPTDAEIAKFVGAKPENTQKTAIDKYVDPRFLDADEVKAAALAEGITLTDEQAKAYVGQKNESSAVTSIRKEYDPQGTTRAEAEKFFTDLGYTPTEKELTTRVGATPDAQQKTAIGKYVDPRQVTEAEARKFYEDLGYTPTAEEVANYVGQGDSNFEKTAPKRVETYVDPRQVTDEEARQFFADLGYDPTDAQVAEFVAQVEETTQQGVISKYVDPRQVTQAEVQAIADEEGLTLTETLAATYLGQSEVDTFQNERLAAARAEYDPLATTLDEATQFFADTGYTATTKEIARFVGSKTEEAQTSAIGSYVDPRQVTAEEAQEFLSAIGYQPTKEEIKQFTGQVNDKNFEVSQQAAIDEYVDPRFFDAGEVRAAYEELGLVDVTQEDVDRFVGQFGPEFEGTGEGFESARLDELRTYMPTATFNVIKQVLGSPAVADDPNTEADESKAATGLYAEFEAGATRDEALQTAIDQLSTELGLTEEAMLEQLGLTEEALSSEIDAVAADVGAVREEVTGLGEQITDVETSLGERIDTSTETLSGDIANAKADLLTLIEANEAAGMTRDEATQTAIGELANAFDVGRTELLTAIGETEASLTSQITDVETSLGEQITDVETSLGEQITDVETSLGADIQTVADLIGKPAREVTQTDIDFVVDLIAQENVAAETIQQYDVTGDGILDVNDQNMLTDALQGNDVTLADTSMFNPATGLYLQQEQDTQTTLDAILDMNTQINTNIETEAKNASQRDFLQAAGMGAFDGRGVTVTTPDPMNINYLYDISGDSIFATPSQASLFASPYGGTRAPTQTAQPVQPTQPFATTPRRFAQGGQVEDETDMLLRILGGS